LKRVDEHEDYNLDLSKKYEEVINGHEASFSSLEL